MCLGLGELTILLKFQLCLVDDVFKPLQRFRELPDILPELPVLRI